MDQWSTEAWFGQCFGTTIRPKLNPALGWSLKWIAPYYVHFWGYPLPPSVRTRTYLMHGPLLEELPRCNTRPPCISVKENNSGWSNSKDHDPTYLCFFFLGHSDIELSPHGSMSHDMRDANYAARSFTNSSETDPLKSWINSIIDALSLST